MFPNKGKCSRENVGLIQGEGKACYKNGYKISMIMNDFQYKLIIGEV